GLVSVQEAVQANPGQGREVAPLTAANTLPQLAEQAGGLDQLERMVAQARVTVLPGAVQDSDLMRRELQRQQEVLARVAPQALDRDMRGGMPAVPQTEEAQSMRRIAQAVGDQAWGDQAWAREPGAPPADLPPVPGTQYRDILKQAWEPDGSTWEMVDYRPAAPGTQYRDILKQAWEPDGSPWEMVDYRPAAPGTPTTSGGTSSGDNRGVYTGATATAPTGTQ